MIGVQSTGPLARPLAGGGVRAPTVAPGASRGSPGASEPAGEQRNPSGAEREAYPTGGNRTGTSVEREAPDGTAEREAWLVLMTAPGLGPVMFTELLAAFGSGRAVLAAATLPDGPRRLRDGIREREKDREGDRDANRDVDREAGQRGWGGRGLGDELARRICDHAAQAPAVVDRVRSLGLSVVTLDERLYPERLRTVEMPPPLLFVQGATAALSMPHAIAIVGTRAATDRGRRFAGWIGSAVARAGAAVVSGLAIGIDGAAHAAVVGERLPTVAVLGGGHARLYPRAHERLAAAIVDAGGAVVAELAPDTPSTRGTFPRRNRLISGLSDATVVVEAGRHSGALITASWALEQGRECFLVPGPLDAPASAGCNAFLRSFAGQARIVAGVPELLEDLGLAVPDDAGTTARSETAGAGRDAVLAGLGTVERSLAEALAAGAATVDQLARRSELQPASILSALTMLELRGLVTSAYGRYRGCGVLARWSP